MRMALGSHPAVTCQLYDLRHKSLNVYDLHAPLGPLFGTIEEVDAHLVPTSSSHVGPKPLHARTLTTPLPPEPSPSCLSYLYPGVSSWWGSPFTPHLNCNVWNIQMSYQSWRRGYASSVTREWQIKTTRYLAPLQSIHFPFSLLSSTSQPPAVPLHALKQPFKKTTSDLKITQGYWARFKSSLCPAFSISSHTEWDISSTNALQVISSQGKSECHVKVISKLLWDHPRSFSAHTHTHTPCPPALQEAKHLWMWETPQMSSSWPHSWSDTLGWASQIAVWLGFFRQLPTSTYGLWEGTHSLPSQPLQGSPKCFPLKTPLSSSPPCPMLDETDYMLVPEAKVIFHSANSYSQQTQDGHRTSELDKTQASVLQFLSMEVVLMTMPASQSTVEKIKWDLAQSPVNSRC